MKLFKRKTGVCKWWQSHEWGVWEVVAEGTVRGRPAQSLRRTCTHCKDVQSKLTVAW